MVGANVDGPSNPSLSGRNESGQANNVSVAVLSAATLRNYSYYTVFYYYGEVGAHDGGSTGSVAADGY